jgi:hypothetical protein
MIALNPSIFSAPPPSFFFHSYRCHGEKREREKIERDIPIKGRCGEAFCSLKLSIETTANTQQTN